MLVAARLQLEKIRVLIPPDTAPGPTIHIQKARAGRDLCNRQSTMKGTKLQIINGLVDAQYIRFC